MGQYQLIECTIEDIHSFGIASVMYCDNQLVTIESFPNLSYSRDAVQHLVDLCNSLDLDPIHLSDVVADFLAA